MSGRYSDYRTRMNEFGPFTRMQNPRNVLPDMSLYARSVEDEVGIPPRVAEGPNGPRLEWTLALRFPRNPEHDRNAILAKARELFGGWSGPPQFLKIALDEEGHLVLRHECGPMHEPMRGVLERTWEAFGGGDVKIIGRRGEAYRNIMQEDASLGVQPVPLLRRAFRSHYGQLDFDDLALHPKELKLLDDWGPGDPAAKVLHRLSAVPEGPTEKLARARELGEIGVFSPFAAEAMDLLLRRFKEGALADVHLSYSGHAMFSMAPLVWGATRLFPAKSFSLFTSTYSGSRESGNLLDLLLRPKRDFILRKGDIEPREQFRGPPSLLGAPSFIDAPILPSRIRPAERFIWEKAAKLLQHAEPSALASGVHRFIIHNADDLKAAKKVKSPFYGVELWSSKIKALEARFIGELYALLGAREVRTKWQAKVGQCQVRIVGAGLLGMAIADAHARLGLPKSQIVLFDTSEEARQSARAAGYVALDPSEAALAERGMRCVSFVATGGPFLEGDTVACLGKQAIVFGVNSGGEVMKRDGSPLPVIRSHEDGLPWDVDTGRGAAQSYSDKVLFLEHADGEIGQLRVIGGFMPVNLLHEQWPDRFHVTGLSVLAAALQLAELEEAKSVGLDAKLDDALVRLAEQHGLLKLRPLDPRYDESPSDLAGDLEHGFAPFPPLRPEDFGSLFPGRELSRRGWR